MVTLSHREGPTFPSSVGASGLVPRAWLGCVTSSADPGESSGGRTLPVGEKGELLRGPRGDPLLLASPRWDGLQGGMPVSMRAEDSRGGYPPAEV